MSTLQATLNSHSRDDLKFHIQPDRQCKYNVTLRRVRATIVAVEKQ